MVCVHNIMTSSADHCMHLLNILLGGNAIIKKYSTCKRELWKSFS